MIWLLLKGLPRALWVFRWHSPVMAQLPLPSQSVVFLLLSLCHSCRVGQTISRDPDPKNLCPLGFRKICTELVSKQSRSRFGIALFCTHCSLECVRLSGIDQSIWRSAHQKEPPSPSLVQCPPAPNPMAYLIHKRLLEGSRYIYHHHKHFTVSTRSCGSTPKVLLQKF